MCLVFFSSQAFSVTLNRIDDTRKRLGMDKYPYHANLAKIKVAVIDTGFVGSEKVLPNSAIKIDAYPAEFITRNGLGDPEESTPLSETVDHGKQMAQIIWAVTGSRPEGPQLYLLNGSGPLNFRRAVRYAMEEKVHIILYSRNWECCNNFDGKGFINDIVNEAANQGIIWINAAGNYGGRVYNGAMESIEKDGTVHFAKTKELRLKSHLDQNTAEITLMWNSMGPEEESGTDKDLDLYLYDENNKIVAQKELTQVLKKPKLDKEKQETFLPREKITFEFSKNSKGKTYRIVVKARTRNFTQQDKVRILVVPQKGPTDDSENPNRLTDAVEFLDATRTGEIMNPADGPKVIAVGNPAPYSAKGNVNGKSKPEILIEETTASFSTGENSDGTSASAAFFAGVVAVLKSYKPDLTREEILAFDRKAMPQLGITTVAFKEFGKLHKEILAGVRELLVENPILAGRYPDGRYTLGTRKPPMEFLKAVCGEMKQGEEVQYFLAMARSRDAKGNTSKRLTCYPQIVNASKASASVPWERNPETRHAYVEIRSVSQTRGNLLPAQGLWQTPSYSILLQKK